MDNTDFYELLLGLEEPWEVENVDVDVERKTVFVDVRCVKNQWASESGTPLALQGYRERKWRHLDTCHLKTIVRARVPRVRHPDGRTELVDVSWAEKGDRFTAMFEAGMVQSLKFSPAVGYAAKRLGCSRKEARRVMARAVGRGLDRRGSPDERHLGVYFERLGREGALRDQSVGIVMLFGAQCGGAIPPVLAVAVGRKEKAVEEALLALSPGTRSAITSVCVGFENSLISLLRRYLPEAAIVHDRSTVLQAASGVAEQLGRCSDDSEGAGYEEVVTSFTEGWERCNSENGGAFLGVWIEKAAACSSALVRNLAAIFEGHRNGILAAFRYPIDGEASRRLAEELKAIRSSSRRLKNPESIREWLLFNLGNLEMMPEHPSPSSPVVPDDFWRIEGRGAG